MISWIMSSKKTLGSLIHDLKKYTTIPPGLEKLLSKCAQGRGTGCVTITFVNVLKIL